MSDEKRERERGGGGGGWGRTGGKADFPTHAEITLDRFTIVGRFSQDVITAIFTNVAIIVPTILPQDMCAWHELRFHQAQLLVTTTSRFPTTLCGLDNI